MAAFAELMRAYREGAGVSQRALARTSEINPAIISRLESGDRMPSGPAQVRAIARALNLSADQADALLGAGGYWPDAMLSLGPQDESLTAVARVLAHDGLTDMAKARFRRMVRLMADQWLDGAEPVGRG